MTDFTPGPWQAETEYDCLDYGFAIIAVDEIRPQIVTPTRGMVAFAHAILPEDIDNGRANAALISAAPDPYAALEAVVRVADRATVEFDMARAALAKASPGLSESPLQPNT